MPVTYRILSTAIAACLLALTGCNKADGDVYAADFDQSCSVASDCVVVAEGDYCECEQCGNAAVAAHEEDDFSDAVNQARESCNSRVQCTPLTETRSSQAICPGMEAGCEDGRCVAVEAEQ